jgi:uncharacterized protein (TIGR00369 family)
MSKAVSKKHVDQTEFDRLARQVFTERDYVGEWLGYRVEEMKSDEILFAMDVKRKHLSLAGPMHGGVIAAFVDMSMGFALFPILAKKGKKCSTIEFKVNYFSPVREGETLYSRGKTKFLGKSHAVMEGHVFRKGDDKKDVAMAVGTYNIY